MTQTTNPMPQMTTTQPRCDNASRVLVPYANRTVSTDEDKSGDIDSLNLVFIVGFALLISVLARYLSTRGRRK